MLTHLRDASRRLLGRLFRDDVFISYTRADGLAYVLALADELVKRKYATFVDLYDTEASGEIPAKVLQRLLHARLLVVVATPFAAESAAMTREVDAFVATRRNIVVVDIEESAEKLAWKDRLTHLPRLVQEKSAAAPSAFVLTGIANAFEYLTRAQWLRRAATASLITFAFVVIASVVGIRIASRQIRESQAAASAIRIANAAGDALRRRAAPMDTILLAAAESLRRNPTAEAYGVAEAALRLRRPLVRSAVTLADAKNLAVSPGGRWIAVMGAKSIELFDRALKRQRIDFLPKLESIDKVVFSPDGNHLAILPETGFDNDYVYLVDLDKQQLTARRGAPLEALAFLTFGRNSNVYFLTQIGFAGNRVTAHRVADGAKLWTADSNQDVGPGNGMVALAAADHRVEIRDEETGRLVGSPLAVAGPYILEVEFSTDGERLLVIFDNGTGAGGFEVYAVRGDGAWERIGSYNTTGSINGATISPDGSRILTASQNTVAVWKGPPYKHVLTIPSSRFTDLEFLHDGRHVAVPDGDAVRIVDTGGSSVRLLESGLVISPNAFFTEGTPGELVLLAKRDRAVTVEVWSGATNGATIAGEGAILDPSGAFAVAIAGNTVRVVDVRGPTVYERTFPEPGGYLATNAGASIVTRALPLMLTNIARATDTILPGSEPRRREKITQGVRLSFNGEWIAEYGTRGIPFDDGGLRVANTRSGATIDSAQYPRPFEDTAISNDGRIIAFTLEDGRLCTRDTRARRDTCSHQKVSGGRVALSADAKLVAAGGQEGVLHLMTTGSTDSRTVEVGGTITRVLFDPEARNAAAIVRRGGMAGTLSEIVLIDVATAGIIMRMFVNYGIGSAAFANARKLVLVDDAGVVRTVAVSPPVTPAEICGAVGRPLELAEWQRLVGKSEQFSNPCAAR